MFSYLNISKIFSRYKLQLLWSVSIALIGYFIFFTVEHITKTSNGFPSYYTASKLLLKGENPTNYYDDDYFSSQVEKNVPGIYEIYLVNLPTTTFLILPLAGFNYQTARVAWILFNLILLLFTLQVIIKRMKFDNIWQPIFLILVFSFQPLYENIVSAQAYIFILCILIFIFFGYVSGKSGLPGILLGVILILKSAGTFVTILFLVKKKWIAFLFTIVTFILLFLVTLPIVSFESWSAYLNKLLGYSTSPTLSITAYQTVHSFFHHIFTFDEKWNPFPLLNLPMMAKYLTLVVTISVIFMSVWFVLKSKNYSLAFGTFVIIGLILNPASIDYHFVLILIPLFVLLNWLKENSTLFYLLIFIISFFMLALDLPYTSHKLTSGLLALIAYPKLYGALGLWILNLVALKIEEKKMVQALN